MERIQPFLSQAEIRLEREGDYAEHKRSDIHCLCPSFKVPVEIKRKMHREVWRATENQLVKKYTRDPETGGRGIYLVLWFGTDQRITRPPKGVRRPESAIEIKKAQEQLLSADLIPLIDVVVLDVSPRDKQKKKATNRKEKSARPRKNAPAGSKKRDPVSSKKTKRTSPPTGN